MPDLFERESKRKEVLLSKQTAKLSDPLTKVVEERQVTPLQALANMALSEQHTKLLRRKLPAGFTIDDSKVTDSVSGEEHTFTLITNHGTECFLLQIPDEILKTPSKENRTAIGYVRDLFIHSSGKKNITLHIIHREIPHASYKTHFKDWLTHLDTTVELIPLNNIEDLLEMRPEACERFLKDELKLYAQTQQVQKRLSALDISTRKIDKLAEIVADLPQFKDEGARGRRVLVEESCGLKECLERFDFDGTPKTVAVDLISKLVRHKHITDPEKTDPVKKGYHALGMLLEVINEMNIPTEHSSFISTLLKKYHLVPDT